MGNSSSTPSSSTTTITTHGEYDVFLSFRGTDTRKTFTSHLYRALDEKKITTFIDTKLVRGEEISDGLWRAIRESKISVIIFSENYAFSKWCLRELAEIMKYREMNNQIVIPVFYEVDPSRVRKQIGSYEAALAKHENGDEVLVSFCFLLLFSSLAAVFSCFFFGWLRLCLLLLFFWAGVFGSLSLYPVFCCCLWASLPPIIDMAVKKKEDEVKKWREALTRASNISGWDSSVARNEAEFVCDIVRDVWNKLNNIRPSCDFEDLVKDLVGIEKYVGIEKHIAGVVSKLCLEVQDFRIIGIWGMGGMGKTTISDVVFHIISNQFENRTYFTSSVRAESEKDNTRLICLRNKILSKVLNIDENQVSGSPNIPQDLKKMLLQKKVLIVFDDVDSIEQLETLAGDLDRLGLGSRIIVTTRDKQVLRNCGVKDHNMYEVKGLNDDEALQLFCKHAFKKNHPTKDFEDLSREMVKIATDVPLAIRVLGSLMYEKGKQYWEGSVDQFQGIKNPTIFDRLKISYNGLNEEEKGLFLDIACFYGVFEFKRYEEDLLSNRTCFLDHLIDKSLVTIESGYIQMHDLLQEMGMEIASKNHSRLWRKEDFIRMLKHNDGIANAVQGILLNLDDIKDKHLISQAIEKMSDLRTLIIKSPYSNGYLPDQLRYLHWIGYPLEVLPSSFNPVNLVELNLSYSNIKQLWEGRKHVPKLKVLNLYECENLISIPDLSDIPSAVIINLTYCKSLIEIHSSTECRVLKRLNLSHCENLIRIPNLSYLPSAESIDLRYCRSLCEILSSRECPKLKQLYLTWCDKLTRIPDLSNIPSAESIDLKYCRSLLEIQSRECLKNLHSLNLSECENLNRLPSNIHIEGSEFSLFSCISLTEFPHISGNITRLDLSFSRVEEVTLTIQSLSKLESLDMKYCESLKRISASICKLKSLDRLNLGGCCKLESFPDILERMELKYLNLSGTAIKELPPSIGYLNKLDLARCSKLESFPDILEGMELKYPYLRETEIKELPPPIGNLNRLQQLVFSGCENLERLPKSIKILSKLYSLKLNYCDMLQSLPELPSSLRRLEAINCKQLIQSLPDESEIDNCASAIGSLYFNFINCLKMNQKAVSNLLIFFRDSVVLKMQRMGTEKIISLFERDERKVVEGSIFLPGSEIPEWFSYKNNGSSINIRGLRNDCGRSSYIMGFAVCLVIGFDDIRFFEHIDVCYDFHIETRDGHKEGFYHQFPMFDMPSKDEFSYSDHIFLGYNLSSECYELFQKLDTLLANRGMSDDVGTSFAFKCSKGRYKVKHCVIQPIYVQSQVMNSDAINQDTCESNDTEETCEPHPKRICTEAKQCSLLRIMSIIQDTVGL